MFLLSSVSEYICYMVKYIYYGNDNILTDCRDDKNVIVFDLDMTIGDFTFISGIYDLVGKDGVDALDVFNRCFRPGMFYILELLSIFKTNHDVHKVVIYTNNTGGKNWVNKIVKYIHKKLNIVLFDDIISAYEVNYGEDPDNRRTSMNKDVHELKTILRLNSNDRIMFIDDMFHENMMNNSVYYIHIQPYVMYYTQSELEYIFKHKYQNKVSNENKHLIISKYKEYGSQYVDMNTECMKMIEFTKLLEIFSIQGRTGYVKL